MERIKAIVKYLIAYGNHYKKEDLIQRLRESGFSEQEIAQGFQWYEHGGIHDSFFNKDAVAPKKRHKPLPLGHLSLFFSLIPLVGFFFALWASEQINRYHHKGREEAFFALLINVLITLLLVLFLLRAFL